MAGANISRHPSQVRFSENDVFIPLPVYFSSRASPVPWRTQTCPRICVDGMTACLQQARRHPAHLCPRQCRSSTILSSFSLHVSARKMLLTSHTVRISARSATPRSRTDASAPYRFHPICLHLLLPTSGTLRHSILHELGRMT